MRPRQAWALALCCTILLAAGEVVSAGRRLEPARSAAPSPSVPRSVGVANARSALGYNLDFPGEWSRLMPFLDLMRDAIRAWLTKGEDFAIAKALRQLEHGDVPGLKDAEGKPATARTSGSLGAAIGFLKEQKRVAERRNLELYVYEGGTHIGSPDPQIQDFLFRVTSAERVYALYTRLFAAYKALGGTIFNCWGWIAPRDPWANAQSLTDRARTKYRAIVDFVRQNPCWWPRCDRAAR